MFPANYIGIEFIELKINMSLFNMNTPQDMYHNNIIGSSTRYNKEPYVLSCTTSPIRVEGTALHPISIFRAEKI